MNAGAVSYYLVARQIDRDRAEVHLGKFDVPVKLSMPDGRDVTDLRLVVDDPRPALAQALRVIADRIDEAVSS